MGKNKKFKFSFFDIFIILIIICVGIVLYLFLGKETVQETVPIRYTIEILDKDEGFSEIIQEGDQIYDNIKNYYMGEVVKVEAIPFAKLVPNYEDGTVVESVMPKRESILLTLEANVTDSGSNLKVDGNYIVKGGQPIAIKGNGYAGEGYVLTIER